MHSEIEKVLIDLLQAAVTGLKPNATYLLALVQDREDPNRDFQSLTGFKTDPAGAAIVNTLGPLRHVVVGPLATMNCCL
jgi:hypothetical protein